TFVVWGLLFGVFLTASYATKKWRKKIVRWTQLRSLPRLHNILNILFTFHLVCLSWIIFRAPTLTAAWNYVTSIRFTLPQHGFSVVVFNLLLALMVYAGESLQRDSLPLFPRVPRPIKIASLALFLCLMAIFAVNTENEFIYFRF